MDDANNDNNDDNADEAEIAAAAAAADAAAEAIEQNDLKLRLLLDQKEELPLRTKMKFN